MIRPAFFIILVASFVVANAHICVMNPVQRGGYDISGPGRDKCFIPQAPCGKSPIGEPQLTLLGGTTFSVFFQQNLNHYNPGWPGYLVVGYAVGTNQTSDNDFVELARIDDYWAHSQAQQTNFSLNVQVPNIECQHCTLSVRYHPNKPTEPVFHQCADIRITKTSLPNEDQWGSIFGVARASKGSDIAKITLDGQVVAVSDPIGLKAVVSPILADGLVTFDPISRNVFFVGDDAGSFAQDKAPSELFSFDVASQTLSGGIPIERPEGSVAQWNAILASNNQAFPLIAIGQVEAGKEKFSYKAYQLSTNGQLGALLGTTPADDTFVNYFWADVDVARNKLYVLSGDENSPFKLRVRLYTIDLKTGNTTSVLVDNAAYTVVAFHVEPKSGLLLAMSPGLFTTATHSWSLVTIDPSSGSAKSVGVSAPEGVYSAFYGGDVYGSLTTDGKLLHVFERADNQTPVLASIDIATGKIVHSTGLQTLQKDKLHSVVYVPATEVTLA